MRTKYSDNEPVAVAYVHQNILTAIRVAKRYGGKCPTVAQLQADFGMSRASAYRWRAAWKCACPEAA